MYKIIVYSPELGARYYSKGFDIQTFSSKEEAQQAAIQAADAYPEFQFIIEEEKTMQEIIILSGEGTTGTTTVYDGERTEAAIQAHLVAARAGGDRWAKAYIYTHNNEAGRVYYNIDEPSDLRNFGPTYDEFFRSRQNGESRTRPGLGITYILTDGFYAEWDPGDDEDTADAMHGPLAWAAYIAGDREYIV